MANREDDCDNCEGWAARVGKIRQNFEKISAKIAQTIAMCETGQEPEEIGRVDDSPRRPPQGRGSQEITVTVRVFDKPQASSASTTGRPPRQTYTVRDGNQASTSSGNNSARSRNIETQRARRTLFNNSEDHGNEEIPRAGFSGTGNTLGDRSPVLQHEGFRYDDDAEHDEVVEYDGRVLRPRELLRKRCPRCNLFQCVCK